MILIEQDFLFISNAEDIIDSTFNKLQIFMNAKYKYFVTGELNNFC